MNLKVKRLGRSPDLNIKSLCKINTEFEYKNTPINIYTNLIKENIKVSFSLICNIGHYIPPVEPIKLDYPGIINIFSNHESIFISWSKIENAVYYELVLNGVTIITEYNNYTFTGLQEDTEYLILLKAKGDQLYYTDSDYTEISVHTTKFVYDPLKLKTPEIYRITTTDYSIEIEWLKVNGARSYEISLDNGEFIETTNSTYKFINLTPDTIYTIIIRALGDGIYYTDSDYIYQNVKTEKEGYIPDEPDIPPEEPDIPIPPEPEDPYLKVFPEEYYQNVSGNLFKFLVKTNTNWKLSYDSTPYLVVLPREKVWASSLSHTLFYRVKTNIYWNINRKLESGYIKVNPLDVMVTPEQHNIKYNVESSIPWYVSYQLKELWDNVKSSDGEILLDKNGEELLIKIT